MFFGFVATLVLFTIALRFVLTIVTFPIILVIALVTRGREDRYDFLAAAATQFLVCLLASGLPALMTRAFTERYAISHTWLYVAVAVWSVLITMAGNLRDKQRIAGELEHMFNASVQGTEQGAAWGFLAGVPFFIAAMIWPNIVASIPGAVPLIGATLLTAAWLSQFWIIRLIAGIGALGYLLTMAFWVIMSGAGILSTLRRGSSQTRDATAPVTEVDRH